MEPVDHDFQPIFGPTTVETLRAKLNQQLLDTDHQYRAAHLTLRYGGLIAHPMQHQGANQLPLPMFDWHDPTNMGALRISMNDVIYSDPPVCFIPPRPLLHFLLPCANFLSQQEQGSRRKSR